MVSGVTDIQSYKTNKGYYSAPQPPTQATKRFSDSALRPWPPMYRSSSNYQPLTPATKLNYNNFNSHYNNSVYSRNKFNFQQLNGVANGKYASSINLSNNKNAKNYFLVSQPYVKNSLVLPNGPFYGRTGDTNNNLLMVDKDHSDKNRFRKLRNPTQSPAYRSCACTRSKSMEDVRTEIVTDWPSYNKDNYNEFKKGRINNGNGMGLMNTKHATRRSMDNLLEVDTSYGKHFKVWYNFVDHLIVCNQDRDFFSTK